MPLQPLQAGHSSLRQRKLESDAEIRCRKYHTLSKSPARVPSCVDDASCLGCFAWGGLDAGSTVAAKAGADAPGGGISLCFCRRGCAAPAQKAATLNAPPRSSPAKQAAPLNAPPYSTRKPASTSLKRTIPFFTYLKLAGQTGQNGGLKKYFCGLNSRRRCI